MNPAEAERLAIPVTWDYDKVYNACWRFTNTNVLDVTNMLEFLDERKQDGFQFFVRSDSDGCLDRVFF